MEPGVGRAGPIPWGSAQCPEVSPSDSGKIDPVSLNLVLLRETEGQGDLWHSLSQQKTNLGEFEAGSLSMEAQEAFLRCFTDTCF